MKMLLLIFLATLSSFPYGSQEDKTNGINGHDSSDISAKLVEAVDDIGLELEEVGEPPKEIIEMLEFVNGMKRQYEPPEELVLPENIERNIVDENILDRWHEIVEQIPTIKATCRDYADKVDETMRDTTDFDAQTMTAVYYANNKNSLIVANHESFFKNLALREACCRYVLGPDSCGDYDVATSLEGEQIIKSLEANLTSLKVPEQLVRMGDIMEQTAMQLIRHGSSQQHHAPVSLTQIVLDRRRNLFLEEAASEINRQVPRLREICFAFVRDVKQRVKALQLDLDLEKILLIWIRNRNVKGFAKIAPNLSQALAIRECCFLSLARKVA